MLPVCVVVLVANLLTRTILFAIHLLVLLLVQMTAVGLPVGMHLLIDLLLPILGPGSFIGVHLTTMDSVGDALLLIVLPLTHHAIAGAIHGRTVVSTDTDSGHRCDLWTTTVDRGKLSAILPHGLLMTLLVHRSLEVVLAKRGLLLGTGLSAHAAVTAVVAHSVVVVIYDEGPVIDIVNIDDVDVVYTAVIGEGSVVPVAALVASATIAEAVVHTSVKSDVRPPISSVEDVGTTAPAPVAGRPEHTD